MTMLDSFACLHSSLPLSQLLSHSFDPRRLRISLFKIDHFGRATLTPSGPRRDFLECDSGESSSMCHHSSSQIARLPEVETNRVQREGNAPPVGGAGAALPLPQQEEQQDQHRATDSGFGSGGSQLFPGYYKPLSWCVDDLQKLRVTCEELLQSCFYFGGINSDTARRLLRPVPVGTFLVRDSADSRFLYSLSMKTERGATSVRILYENGLFQFDCDHGIRHAMPRFESVLALVDFYVLLSQEGGNQVWRWEEISGDKHMKMTLLKPMRSQVPSLAHLARVEVNRRLDNVFFPHLSVDRLDLPGNLRDYLKAYPYRS